MIMYEYIEFSSLSVGGTQKERERDVDDITLSLYYHHLLKLLGGLAFGLVPLLGTFLS